MKKDDFSDHFKRLARSEVACLGDHPQAEELLAYHEDRLAATRAAQIQTHLGLCRECATTVLDLGNFPAIPLRVRGHDRTEADQEIDWLAIEARIAEESITDGREAAALGERPSVGMVSATVFRPPFKASLWLMIAATVFLTTTLTLVAQRYLAPGPVGRAWEAPRANLHFEELFPVDAPDTRSTVLTRIRLPIQASSLVLILTMGSSQEHASYRATITGGSESHRWQLEKLIRARDGSFSVELPRAVLSEGSYHLELDALDAETPISVARYRFDLELE